MGGQHTRHKIQQRGQRQENLRAYPLYSTELNLSRFRRIINVENRQLLFIISNTIFINSMHLTESI